jgi:hypothetical protein
MWLFILFGAIVMGIGIWLVRLGLVHDSPTSVHGEREGAGAFGITSPFPGVTVILIAIGLIALGLVSVGTGDSDDNKNKVVAKRTPRPKPAPSASQSTSAGSAMTTTTDARTNATQTSTETPADSSSDQPSTQTTAESSSDQPSTQTTTQSSDQPAPEPCVQAPDVPSRVGPWAGCSNDIDLIVSRVQRRGGSVRVYVRVENNSDYHAYIPEDGFLAVTASGQYGVDEDRSSWPYGYYEALHLGPGRRRAGYITLDEPVPSGVTTLRVDLNVATSDEQYYDEDRDTFFVIRLPVRLG